MIRKTLNLLFFKSIFITDLKFINLEYDFESILNVDNFNEWFNDPNNGDTYAHSGIFLRTDKLSQGHFDEYFNSCEGVDNLEHFKEEATFKNIYNFENSVRNDWFDKQKK
jgi:hypothetical protein